MISRKQKIELVKNFKEKLDKAKTVIFADFTGLTVSETQDLRNQLRETNNQFQVIKKSLLKRIYPDTEYSGAIAVAIGDDEIVLSKILYNFGKIKILGSRDLDLAMIETLAKLPTKQELLTKLSYLLKNNINKLILCLKNIKV